MITQTQPAISLAVDVADVQAGEISKRIVPEAWLHSELAAAANRLESGLATNLDLFVADINPRVSAAVVN